MYKKISIILISLSCFVLFNNNYFAMEKMERQEPPKLQPRFVGRARVPNNPSKLIDRLDTSLYQALQNNNLDEAKEAIAQKADVNLTISSMGFRHALAPGEITLLGMAIERRSLPQVKLLVENGAKIYPYDLIRAFDHIDPKVLAYLLSLPNVNITDFLNFLEKERHTKVSKLIIDAIINMATYKQNEVVNEIINLLSKPIETKDKTDEEIIKSSLISLLGRINPDIVRDNLGNNIIHMAIRNQNFVAAKILAELYPDYLKQKNNLGDTPIEWGFGLLSGSSGFEEFINLLKKSSLITQEDIDKAEQKVEQFHEREAASMREELSQEEEKKELE